MTPEDFALYFKETTPWPDYSNTCDGFKAGNPKQPITKVAVSWKASWGALKFAQDNGCNFFISHESIFTNGANGNEMELKHYHAMETKKAQWITESGLCIYRCHDTVDLLPDFGIRDQWAKGLGFSDFEIKGEPAYYTLCHTEPVTLVQLAYDIGKKIKPLGENGVLIFGDPDRVICTVATGTGAITDPFIMASYNPDCCILTDDFFRTVREGEFLLESGLCAIMVNHGVSEEWGMQAFCGYLKENFPEVEFVFVPHTCIYRHVVTS